MNKESISWLRIKPVINKIIGKPLEVKEEEYTKLNKLDQSLFSFYVYYNHAIKDYNSFIYWSNYFKESNQYTTILKGVSFFKNSKLKSLLSEVLNLPINSYSNEIYHNFIKEGKKHIELIDSYIQTLS